MAMYVKREFSTCKTWYNLLQYRSQTFFTPWQNVDFLSPFEEGEIVQVSVAEARNQDITLAHFIFIIELGTTNKMECSKQLYSKR